jgi:hypothetical protein
VWQTEMYIDKPFAFEEGRTEAGVHQLAGQFPT